MPLSRARNRRKSATPMGLGRLDNGARATAHSAMFSGCSAALGGCLRPLSGGGYLSLIHI
eukprot:9287669-Alexandrium_andersonii.AAC.1